MKLLILFIQVLDMMDMSLKGLSLMQSEVIISHSVKLMGKLLQLQETHPTLRPSLSKFQLHLSKRISAVLELTENKEVRTGQGGGGRWGYVTFLTIFWESAL